MQAPLRDAATRYFPSTLQLPLLRVHVTFPFDTVEAMRESKNRDFAFIVATFCTKPPTTTWGTACDAATADAPSASTLNVGVAPLARPPTVHVTAVVLHTSTPSEVFTTYPVGAPLLSTAADHVRTTALFPGTALTNSGAVTQVALGVTAFDAGDAALMPITFVAATVNVYAERFCKPGNTHESSEVVHVAPPGEEVAVYVVIALPPFAGATHVTVAAPSPATAFGALGAEGVVAGTT